MSFTGEKYEIKIMRDNNPNESMESSPLKIHHVLNDIMYLSRN